MAHTFKLGRVILKAIGKRKAVIGPSSAQIEHERELWGPNPIPGHSEAEDLLYLHGERFLMLLYGAVFGVDTKGRQFTKAIGDGPFKGPVGWGDLAKLYNAGGDPDKQMDAWGQVLDKLIEKLIPATSTEQVAGAWAVRTVLLGKLGNKVAEGKWPSFESLIPTLGEHEAQVLKWNKARAAMFVTEISDKARDAVRRELVTGAMEKASIKQVQQRLFDKFSGQNRDWRRVALTETAFAVQNARLASVDPKDGWEVAWSASPKACPFCKKQHGKRFRLVDSNAPNKDGQTQVWVGKHNVGRSSSARKKDGTLRTEDELWWPALPAHPNCVCQFTLFRVRKQLPVKIASGGQNVVR